MTERPTDSDTGPDTGTDTGTGPGTDPQPPAAAGDGPPPVADVPAAGVVPGRSGRGRLLVQRAAVLLGTLGLLAGVLHLVDRTRDAAEVASYYRPSSAPMNAARDAGRLLFSYDHRTIDEDFATAAALTTGTFAEEYEKTTTSVVRPVAVENEAVVEATAVAQAVAGAEPGRVVALVFVNQVTTSTAVQGEKVDQSRVRMTLVERDGEWLVSKVEAL